MGYGIDVVTGSKQFQDEVSITIRGTLALMAFMYIFDSHFWPTPLRIVAWTSIFIAFSVSICLMVSDVPYGPLCIFTLLVPLSMFGIKNTFYEDVPANLLVGLSYKVYVHIAAIILIVFFYWCSIDGNMWDSVTNAEYSHAAGCDVDFSGLEECESPHAVGVPCFFDPMYQNINFSDRCTSLCLDVYQACEEAFITWSFPGLAAMSLFVIGFICKYLREPDDPHANHHISALAKFTGVFLFLFWIFASLAGAGEGLSSSLIAFAVSITIGSAIVFSVVFWNSLVTADIDGEKIIGTAEEQAGSYLDLLRGLIILGFTPLLIVYLLVSIVNQFVRRIFTRKCCGKRMSGAEMEHKGLFTLSAALQIEDFFTWDHAKVLSYAVYCGVGYVFLSKLRCNLFNMFLQLLLIDCLSLILFLSKTMNDCIILLYLRCSRIQVHHRIP